MTKIEKKTVQCSTCNGVFDAELPNCPFCGTMNIPAAEDEYMDKLEDIREDLQDLHKDTLKVTGHQGKKILRFVIILVLFFAVFGVIEIVYSEHKEKEYARRSKEEFLWQQTAFPEMEALYESGKYEELADLYVSYNNGDHTFYQFQYRSFCKYMMDLRQAKESLEKYGNDGGMQDFILMDELQLFDLEYVDDIDEAGRAYLEEQRAPYLEDFERRFHMSEEDLSAFKKDLRERGYIRFQDCKDYVKEHGIGEE